MKSKKELKKLKEEVEAVSKKLAELTEEELMQVTGGQQYDIHIYENEVDNKEFKPNF